MNELKSDAIVDYTLAGNATVTLQSGNTGVHFTYKVKQSKTQEHLYFIHLLSGPDNEDDYQYIGCYYSDTSIRLRLGKTRCRWHGRHHSEQ